MTEDNLDREIDLVLQQMAGGEGPADLRRRVLSRLAEAPGRSVWRGMALATTAVFMLAVGTAVVLRGRAVQSPATTAAHRDVPQAAFPLSPPPASAGSALPTQTVRPAVRPVSRQAASRQAPERLTAAAADAVVAEMEPIELSPLAVAPMASEHVTVGALRIERLQIEPLAEAQP